MADDFAAAQRQKQTHIHMYVIKERGDGLHARGKCTAILVVRLVYKLVNKVTADRSKGIDC
jgi:hypothetical protein